MRDFAQGPGRAAQSAGTAAENAQLDAQLELAAKKVALRSLEAQVGAPATEGDVATPSVPGARRTTVTIEKDGKTIVLENPTPQQLAQVGVGVSQRAGPDPVVLIMLTSMTLAAIVVVVSMVLRHVRNGRPDGAQRDRAETAARMERIENAIESVAVEVERISEGQRFTTRMLSEGPAMSVAAAAQGERVIRNDGEG